MWAARHGDGHAAFAVALTTIFTDIQPWYEELCAIKHDNCEDQGGLKEIARTIASRLIFARRYLTLARTNLDEECTREVRPRKLDISIEAQYAWLRRVTIEEWLASIDDYRKHCEM